MFEEDDAKKDINSEDIFEDMIPGQAAEGISGEAVPEQVAQDKPEESAPEQEAEDVPGESEEELSFEREIKQAAGDKGEE